MGSRLLRNSTFGLIASLTTTIGNFASGLIVARVLGVEGSGVLAFAIWLATTCVTISSVGVPFTLNRFIPELMAQGKTDVADQLTIWLLKPYMALAIATPSLVLLLAFAFLPPSLNASSGMTPMLWAIVVACALTQSAADFARGHLRGVQRFDMIAKVSIVAAVCQPIFVGVAGYKFGIIGAMSGYAFGNLIPALLLFALPRPKAEIPADLRYRVFRYAAFRWGSEIMAAFIWSRLEIFFLQISWGSGPIGLFSTGLTLANLAIQLPVMLTWGFVPHFAEKAGRQQFGQLQDDFATGTRIMAFMLLPSCIGLAAILPVLVPLLYGQAFAGAAPVAAILVCGAGLMTSMTVVWNVIWAMERTDVDLALGLTGAVLATIGGLTLIPWLGPIGAALSRSLAQICVSLLAVGFVVTRLGFSFPFADVGKILFCALVCGLAARLCLLVVSGPSGLPLAIAAGSVAYFVCVRSVKALPPSDIDRFRLLIGRLPQRFSVPANQFLDVVAGRAP